MDRAWKKMDYKIVENEKSSDTTTSYRFWASKRVRDVVALKDWATDPINYEPPVKVKKMVEKI